MTVGPYGIAGAAAVGAIAGVMLFSSYTKIEQPTSAMAAMKRFGLVAQENITFVRMLALTEGVAALALLSGSTAIAAMSGALITLGLLAGVALQVRALGNGDVFPCGCFGDETPISGRTVVRTSAMSLLSAFACASIISFSVPIDLSYAFGLLTLSALLVARCTSVALTTRKAVG